MSFHYDAAHSTLIKFMCFRFNKTIRLSSQTNKNHMASGQGSHWLISSQLLVFQGKNLAGVLGPAAHWIDC